jgi:hypothetical protein
MANVGNNRILTTYFYKKNMNTSQKKFDAFIDDASLYEEGVASQSRSFYMGNY